MGTHLESDARRRVGVSCRGTRRVMGRLQHRSSREALRENDHALVAAGISEAQHSSGGDLFLSNVEKVQLDCGNDRQRVLLVIYYSENNIAGSQQQEENDPKHAPWEAVVPARRVIPYSSGRAVNRTLGSAPLLKVPGARPRSRAWTDRRTDPPESRSHELEYRCRFNPRKRNSEAAKDSVTVPRARGMSLILANALKLEQRTRHARERIAGEQKHGFLRFARADIGDVDERLDGLRLRSRMRRHPQITELELPIAKAEAEREQRIVATSKYLLVKWSLAEPACARPFPKKIGT